jgi:phosphate transport system permease protein
MTWSANTISFHRDTEKLRRGGSRGREVITERCFALVLWAMGFLAVTMVAIMLVTLWLGASPVLLDAGLGAFLLNSEWQPTESAFGALSMAAGTFAVSLGALAIAVPIAVMCALLLHFYLPARLAGLFRCVLQMLAGIPSVVYGLWGLIVIVPMLASLGGSGACLLAGVVILAMMIIPTVSVVVETSVQQLSPAIYQGALALGAPRYRALLRVVLPAISAKLIAASILGLARAVGETMAVLMVSGNAIAMPDGLLDSVRTLAANIALEMAYAMDLHRAALFASGLILMAMVLALLALVDRLEGAADHA